MTPSSAASEPHTANASRTLSTRAAAFFDVDGTLVSTTIAHYYAYLRRKHLPPLLSELWYLTFLARCGGYLVLDKIDRTRFNEVFYRNYAGMPAAQTRVDARSCYHDVMRLRIFPSARECLENHRQKGRRLVLVTGSLDFLIAPLAGELRVDDVICASLVESRDRFTGVLAGPPIGDREKARRIAAFAHDGGVDLSLSHAYGDSIADLPMLESVGFPHAVNPDRRLRAEAKERCWPVHRWTTTGSAQDNGR